MNNYDLSIVIPCLNSAATVGKTIDSINNQLTFYSVQLIFSIDEHTTDKTIETIRNKMKDSSFPFVIVSSSGGSCGIVDNDGANVASGKYIWFVDSDDWLLDNKFIIEKAMTLCISKNLSTLEFDFESKFPNKNTMTTWRHIYESKYVHNMQFNNSKVGSDSMFNLMLKLNSEYMSRYMKINDVFYHYSWPILTVQLEEK